MTDQGEVLRLASLEEAPRLFQLILRRITWLEERGIRQWERDDYLTYYPLTYFQERARNGELYGLWRPDGAPMWWRCCWKRMIVGLLGGPRSMSITWPLTRMPQARGAGC